MTETIHACLPGLSGVTPCCGKTPFELPPTDYMTIDPQAVTCTPDAAPAPGLMQCPTCGPTPTEPHPRRAGARCANCKEPAPAEAAEAGCGAAVDCEHPADEHSVYGCADGCACEWTPKRPAPIRRVPRLTGPVTAATPCLFCQLDDPAANRIMLENATCYARYDNFPAPPRPRRDRAQTARRIVLRPHPDRGCRRARAPPCRPPDHRRRAPP